MPVAARRSNEVRFAKCPSLKLREAKHMIHPSSFILVSLSRYVNLCNENSRPVPSLVIVF
jgi:hypothetical protein